MLRAGSTPDTYIRRRSLSTSCPVQAFGKRKVRRRQHSRLGTACSFQPGQFTLIGTPAQPTDSVSWNLSWLKKTRDDLSVQNSSRLKPPSAVLAEKTLYSSISGYSSPSGAPGAGIGTPEEPSRPLSAPPAILPAPPTTTPQTSQKPRRKAINLCLIVDLFSIRVKTLREYH